MMPLEAGDAEADDETEECTMPQNNVTVVALQTLGNHKVLLLSNGQVHIFADPAIQVYLRPAETTVLYDFLLENLSFIERRKQQNEKN